MIGQHCLTHSHKLIIGKLISASNWHLVHLFNLQDLGPTLGPKSGRVEIKLYKKSPCHDHVFQFPFPIREGVKKKREKSGQADRLGRPPLPRSGQENVKNSRQVVIFGVILPFYKG